MNIKRLAIIVLVFISVTTVGALYLSLSTTFDYDFENFFPRKDPDTGFFSEYRLKFETDNDFVLVGVENREGVFKEDFLVKIDALTDTLASLHGVVNVTSPSNYHDNIMSSFPRRVLKSYVLDWDNPETYSRDSSRIYKRKELVGTYFAEDAKSVAIYVKTKAFLSKAGCDSLSAQLSTAIPKFGFDDTHLVGRSVVQTFYLGVMMNDLKTFIILSAVLLVIFLIIAFRSFWGVWIPLTVIVFSVVWILGFMQLIGEPINLMLTILPTILAVVGISDIIHVVSRYLDELRSGEQKKIALKKSFREVSIATFLTSATTAIGFLTLTTSSVRPIQNFGLYTAIGVMFAYILAYTLLPSVLALKNTPRISQNKKIGEGWIKILSGVFLLVIRKPVHVIIGFVFLIAICLYGAFQIEVQSFLLEDLREDSKARVDMTFFDKQFSGVRPFEVGLWMKDSTSINAKSFLDRDVLIELEKMENYLFDEYKVGFIYSPVQLIKYLNRSFHAGDEEYLKIPESDEELNMLRKLIEKTKHKDYVRTVLFGNGNICRITGKIGDWGSKAIVSKNKALKNFFDNETALPEYMKYKITGTASLIDKNNDTLVSNLVKGLAIAFVIISLIVGFMYRSLKMVFISFIPNILPLIMVAAIMGYSGIELKVSTSIIFTIVFGIAVDDTIHFMSKLRLELKKQKSLIYALKRTYFSTGRAIILTSLILSSGFLMLLGSEFLVTYNMGLLVSFALLFAMLADLLLLPALVIVFYRK